ncbi:MAG TPA: hypothetical protein VJ833_03825 [Rhodanobacteraceae bacterium]|nr:hypothetical protein [Rhodanobacteraceae bacterium]
MIDKVRFCRKRILRRAGTAFACTCIAGLLRIENSREAPGLREGTQIGRATSQLADL